MYRHLISYLMLDYKRDAKIFMPRLMRARAGSLCGIICPVTGRLMNVW